MMLASISRASLRDGLIEAEIEAFRRAELRAGHLGEGDGGERLADRQIDGLPMRPCRAEFVALAIGLVNRALGHTDRTVDRRDDLGDRDRAGVAGKPIAAGGAAQGRDDPRMRQTLQHLGDRCLRQPCLRGKHGWVDLPVRMARQVLVWLAAALVTGVGGSWLSYIGTRAMSSIPSDVG